MLSGEATNTNFIVFGLTRPGLEPIISSNVTYSCHDIAKEFVHVVLNNIHSLYLPINIYQPETWMLNVNWIELIVQLLALLKKESLIYESTYMYDLMLFQIFQCIIFGSQKEYFHFGNSCSF